MELDSCNRRTGSQVCINLCTSTFISSYTEGRTGMAALILQEEKQTECQRLPDLSELALHWTSVDITQITEGPLFSPPSIPWPSLQGGWWHCPTIYLHLVKVCGKGPITFNKHFAPAKLCEVALLKWCRQLPSFKRHAQNGSIKISCNLFPSIWCCLTVQTFERQKILNYNLFLLLFLWFLLLGVSWEGNSRRMRMTRL